MWPAGLQDRVDAGAIATSGPCCEPQASAALCISNRGEIKGRSQTWRMQLSGAHSSQTTLVWSNSKSREGLLWKRGPGSLDEAARGDSSSEPQPFCSQECGCYRGLSLACGESRLHSETFFKENLFPLEYQDLSCKDLQMCFPPAPPPSAATASLIFLYSKQA